MHMSLVHRVEVVRVRVRVRVMVRVKVTSHTRIFS